MPPHYVPMKPEAPFGKYGALQMDDQDRSLIGSFFAPIEASISPSTFKVTLSNVLDILNIQGPKVQQQAKLILVQPRPWDSGQSLDAIVEGTAGLLKPNGMEKEERETLYGLVAQHMKQAEEILSMHPPKDAALALDILRKGLEIVPNWNFVGSGRIDQAPQLPEGMVDEAIVQPLSHALRHLMFPQLPFFPTFDSVSRFRAELFPSADHQSD